MTHSLDFSSSFVASARIYMSEARTLGASFHSDGSYASPKPLPAYLSDHLRVLRSAIAIVVAAEDAQAHSQR